MTIRYETAITTFAQLAVATLFVMLGGVFDTVKHCTEASDCVANSFLWLIIVFMVAIWFIMLCSLGYLAQEKRSYKLARLLIAGELFTAFITFMLFSHPSSPISAIGALTVFGLSVWTIILAWRIYKARGSRIVTPAQKTRPRRRPTARKS
jgi:hypothetical protein